MRLSRRKFVWLGCGTVVAMATAYPFMVELNWLKVRRITVGNGPRKLRVVHFSDFHFKGDDQLAQRMVRLINQESPDIVFFTGDLVEKKSFAEEAIRFIKQINAPVYACPGNHDLASGISFTNLAKAFSSTGGDWLWDSSKWVTTQGLTISAVNWWENPPPATPPAGFRVLLCHYPAFVDKLASDAFNLVLSGHSHGGQVRIPGYGALLLPYGVGRYDLGVYRHPAGLLNVTSGIGWVTTPVRFCCRPEIVSIAINLAA